MGMKPKDAESTLKELWSEVHNETNETINDTDFELVDSVPAIPTKLVPPSTVTIASLDARLRLMEDIQDGLLKGQERLLEVAQKLLENQTSIIKDFSTTKKEHILGMHVNSTTKRARSDQIEPKTKKSTSIRIMPEFFPWNPRLSDDKPRTASWAYGNSFTSKPVRLEHLPSPRNPGNLTPPPLLTDIKCQICGGDHGSTYCSYWVKVPDGAKLIEDSCYQIFCECNAPIVDGDCPSSVCSGRRPRKIAPRSVRYMTPINPIQ